MTATQAEPVTAHSSWFPWRHNSEHVHPALKEVHDSRTLGERVADQIASFGGSWPFILIFLGLILGWMLIKHAAHRAYPGREGIRPPSVRAAARDEILAQHHYEETQKIDQLLQTNTDLTQQVHELTAKVHRLTEHLCNTSGVN